MTKITRIASSSRSVSRVEGQRRSTGDFYDTKVKQVLPEGPTIKCQDRTIKPSLKGTHLQKPSFFEAFGTLGIPMVLILVLCLVWTAWLIFVSVAPNEAANWLMNTEAYDNGQFWLIIDTNPNLTIAGVVCLVIVGLCYLFATLKMLFWRENVFTPVMIRRLEARLLDSWNGSRLESRTMSVVVGPGYRRINLMWMEFTSFNGKKRNFWNVFTKSVDLVMQTIVFLQLLKRGSPVELVCGYAIYMAANSPQISCQIKSQPLQRSWSTPFLISPQPSFFPIATLIFCYNNFDFDREVYLSYLDKLLPGSFEHIARLFADQSEIALFGNEPAILLPYQTNDGSNGLAMAPLMEIWTDAEKSSGNIIPIDRRKPVPKVIAILFIGFSVAVVMVAQQSVSRSIAVCSAHPECVVYSHQWSSKHTTCPCLIFVYVDKTPKTFEEWMHPPDSYDTLKEVSASGKLESIQVINRQLLEFPEELRLCRGLKAIQLTYTNTQNVPDWTGEFRHLETLHVEGKLGSTNLLELPDDLFGNMPNLAMVHLGVREGLRRIPPLTGVPHLQSLSLAWLFQLHQLPNSDRIPNLRRLVISVVPFLEWVPDMSPLRKLIEFTMLPGYICCNGFVGPCDLTDFFCSGNPLLTSPPATCLMDDANPTLPVTPYLGNSATKTIFEELAPHACMKWAPGTVYIDNTPTKEKIDMCGGKLFRECHLPGNVTGICYNMRFQVLSCINDDSRIALRRYQIEMNIGSFCDPVEEKWLGCKG